MKRLKYTSSIACLFVLAGCRFVPSLDGTPTERSISEVEMRIQTGLLGANAELVMRQDGAAVLTCNLSRLNEEDIKEDSLQVNAIDVCGKRYKTSPNAFVKTRSDGGREYLHSISKGTIAPEQFSQLTHLIVRNGYFSMDDDYTIPGLMDAPPTITRVIYAGREKQVSNQGGKAGPKMMEIEKAILSLATELEWR